MNSAPSIVVYCQEPSLMLQARSAAEEEVLPFCSEGLEALVSRGTFVLDFCVQGVVLRFLEKGKARELVVSFISGAKDHRRKYGGGKGQAIAKAVGVSASKRQLRVLDATAGQGGDAFVLASLGCELSLIERSPVAKMLLRDALFRGRVFAEKEGNKALLEIFSRMALLPGNFIHLASSRALSMYDVVYLDPMFPARKKSALVKKEMQVFHQIIGGDDDADELLAPALNLANYRVVVKRPLVAPYLAQEEPSYQLKGKSSRFDIYTKRALKK